MGEGFGLPADVGLMSSQVVLDAGELGRALGLHLGPQVNVETAEGVHQQLDAVARLAGA